MALDELQERTVRQNDAASRALLGFLGQAIVAKSLLWVALLAAVGLWSWAAIRPDWIRTATVAGYTVTVLLPLLYWKGMR